MFACCPFVLFKMLEYHGLPGVVVGSAVVGAIVVVSVCVCVSVVSSVVGAAAVVSALSGLSV